MRVSKNNFPIDNIKNMKGNYMVARKGAGSRLIGAIKGGLENPLVRFGVSALSPELGAGLEALNKSGLLKKSMSK
jgi:hypothetical protein